MLALVQVSAHTEISRQFEYNLTPACHDQLSDDLRGAGDAHPSEVFPRKPATVIGRRGAPAVASGPQSGRVRVGRRRALCRTRLCGRKHSEQ